MNAQIRYKIYLNYKTLLFLNTILYINSDVIYLNKNHYQQNRQLIIYNN